MLKKAALSAAIGGMAVFAIGCAITDYDGWSGHQTASEAKLWGSEVAFSGFGGDYDGTYSYTVKYAPGSPVTINSYKNPVVGSFSRDGMIDRDGDDVQGRGGFLGGKFNKWWVAVDRAPGTCEFFSNITYDKSALGPGVASCNSASEEVDRDLELQDAFASLGDLFTQIWSGALGKNFTVQMTSVTVNGAAVPLADALTVNLRQNGVRPMSASLDLSSPGGQDLIRALLNNTPDKQPVTLGFGFSGGMAFGVPTSMTLAFNHAALRAALK